MSEPPVLRIPAAALLLGMLGVLPFAALGLAAAIGANVGPIAGMPGLLTYGAVILSFMGGAQWGLTVAGSSSDGRGLWRRFGVSVVPALVGWAALLPPARLGLTLLAAAFALLAAYDLWTVRRGEAPAWYGRLRLGLSCAVVACLALVVIAGRLSAA
jgi:hypothetical protein